ncbi:MAG: hypothetical protein AAB728_00840 [Patescibacteria group bacterium]
MGIIFPIIGIVASFFLLKYRERVGDMVGEGEWMKKIGGVYMVVIVVAVFLFFWSVAELTGTTDILFRPLTLLIPGYRQPEVPPAF